MPPFQAGQKITAAQLDAFCAPQAIIKPSDQSVTSSTVAVNDTALVLSLLASATYWVECFLLYEGGTSGSSDLAINFANPAGAQAQLVANGRNTAGVAITWGIMPVTQQNLGTNGAGVLLGASIFGTVLMGVTAGNLQLKWAQVTSNATPTIVHKGSSLLAWRIT